jgi:hypothetical protein
MFCGNTTGHVLSRISMQMAFGEADASGKRGLRVYELLPEKRPA